MKRAVMILPGKTRFDLLKCKKRLNDEQETDESALRRAAPTRQVAPQPAGHGTAERRNVYV